MRRDLLVDAINEAHRFLKRATPLLRAQRDDQVWITMQPKQTGEVKRASMDLTRALADLRRRES